MRLVYLVLISLGHGCIRRDYVCVITTLLISQWKLLRLKLIGLLGHLWHSLASKYQLLRSLMIIRYRDQHSVYKLVLSYEDYHRA